MDERKIRQKLADAAADLITRHDAAQVRFDAWLPGVFRRITDAAAALVTWHDKAQARLIRWLPTPYRYLTTGAAAVITFHDRTWLRLDRLALIVHYHVAKAIHLGRQKIRGKKKMILSHFAGVVLIAVGMLAMFNYATGYAYMYHGKVLGYVKDQEDVLKILDLVSDELTKEYGSTIQIDQERDMRFRSVVVLDKDVDDIDTVLKRLTYMSEMQAEASALYIDNRLFAICEDETAVRQVLREVQEAFLQENDVDYESIGFKDKIRIEPYNTKLAYISGVRACVDKILTGVNEEEVYKVKAGDTYSGICEKFDITIEELKKNNPGLDTDRLMPGDELIMQKAVSALTVVTVETGTYAEKIKHETKYEDDDSMYEGDEQVLQEGVDGKQAVTARITRENGEIVKRDVLSTETLREPVTEIIRRGTAPRPKTAPTGHFIMPVAGYTLTSEFGWRWGRNHDGLDLACPTGTPIWASDGGNVVYAGWYSGYGLFIEIDHGGGKVTRYGHCSSINVSAGEAVFQGQKIGEVGSTGNSTGPHCHFEIVINGSPVDPFGYL